MTAQMKAILWRADFQTANARFLELLQEPLKDGIKILFLAKILFDASHGLSLHILEIDPVFTLGDLEREKKETIARLHAEGVFGQNKQLSMPLLPKRIAIISVETSKGLADFLNIIRTNPWRYRFECTLFPSLLQGDKAVEAIVNQLGRIAETQERFDVAAIIRGGGGDIGLSCYNKYTIAKSIATFPLPLLTGIGHATNETVAETVAKFNAITPTQLAEHLLKYFHAFSQRIVFAEEKNKNLHSETIAKERSALTRLSQGFSVSVLRQLVARKERLHRSGQSLSMNAGFLLEKHKTQLASTVQRISLAQKSKIEMSRYRIQGLGHSLSVSVQSLLKKQQQLASNSVMELQNATARYFVDEAENLAVQKKNILAMDPMQVLKRGYAMVSNLDGTSLTKASDLHPDKKLIVRFHDGQTTASVNEIKLYPKDEG